MISNAPCTTNCLAPMAKVLNDTVWHQARVDETTIHAYTADQRLQDLPHKDLRRARAASEINLIPASTGAAKAIGLVIPALQGKLHGFAVRAPVPTGSGRRSDRRVARAGPTTVEEVNAFPLKSASEARRCRAMIAYTEDPIVSSDIGRLRLLLDRRLPALPRWWTLRCLKVGGLV